LGTRQPTSEIDIGRAIRVVFPVFDGGHSTTTLAARMADRPAVHRTLAELDDLGFTLRAALDKEMPESSIAGPHALRINHAEVPMPTNFSLILQRPGAIDDSPWVTKRTVRQYFPITENTDYVD
jgi:hypothetical protein